MIDEDVADGFHGAETLERLAPRVIGGHAATDVVLHAHVDVKRELIVHVGGDIRLREAQVTQPAWSRRPIAHARAGAARSTRVTACEYRIQTAASLRRCFRPSPVIW